MRLYTPNPNTQVLANGSTKFINIQDTVAIDMVIVGTAGTVFSVQTSIGGNTWNIGNQLVIPAGSITGFVLNRESRNGLYVAPAAGAFATVPIIGDLLIITNSGPNQITLLYNLWLDTDG